MLPVLVLTSVVPIKHPNQAVCSLPGVSAGASFESPPPQQTDRQADRQLLVFCRLFTSISSILVNDATPQAGAQLWALISSLCPGFNLTSTPQQPDLASCELTPRFSACGRVASAHRKQSPQAGTSVIVDVGATRWPRFGFLSGQTGVEERRRA